MGNKFMRVYCGIGAPPMPDEELMEAFEKELVDHFQDSEGKVEAVEVMEVVRAHFSEFTPRLAEKIRSDIRDKFCELQGEELLTPKHYRDYIWSEHASKWNTELEGPPRRKREEAGATVEPAA